jgi:hypothetical protein
LSELEARTPEEAPELHARAPWYSEEALRDRDDLLPRYYNSLGYLPGEIPGRAITTPDWTRRIALPVRAYAHHPAGVQAARTRLVEAVTARFNRTTQGLDMFPNNWDLDTWSPRISEEYEYARDLARLDMSDWPDDPRVMTRAMLYDYSILPADFRTRRRLSVPWFEGMRFERQGRNRYGLLLAHQWREAEAMDPEHMVHRYPRVPDWFAEYYEVPQGCFAELGPSVTYVGFWLMERRDTPYWSIFLTEWCVNVAQTLLWDAYDRLYLWYVPRHVEGGIRYLVDDNALDVPLGGRANVNEMVALLDISAGINWDNVPRGNSHRSPPPCAMYSPGRTAPAGDFVHFDPATRAEITQARHTQLLRARTAGEVAPPLAEAEPGPSTVTRPAPRSRNRSRARRRNSRRTSSGWATAVKEEEPAVPQGPESRGGMTPGAGPSSARGPGHSAVPVPPGTPRYLGGSSARGAMGSTTAATGRAPSSADDVVVISDDDTKPEVKPEPGVAPETAPAADTTDAVIGRTAEAMLAAGVDADAIRKTIAELRNQRQRRD